VDGSRYLTQATNSVAGLLTGEERDQLAPPRPVVGTETSSAPVEVESEPAGLPPVVVTIRRMYRDQYRLETLPLSASAESASIRQEAMQASSATNVLELLSQMDAGLAARVGSYTTGSVMREAKEKLADLKQGAYGVAAMAVTLAEQRQRREQEARRQIEASNALVRAQQEEAARQKLIASEMASVQTREHEFLDRVHHGEYNDVRLFLVAMQPSLTTEEGLRALHTAIERLNRMESLHKFVIDYIAGYQNKNGWKIVSADNDGVLVSNQNITKSVSWNDLGEVRLILFFNYLLMDEEGSAKLRLRERVNQLINASMYCKQFLASNSDAQENAGKMLAKAIALLPDAVIDIERLIPGGMGKTPDASGAAASTTNQVGAESAAAKQP